MRLKEFGLGHPIRAGPRKRSRTLQRRWARTLAVRLVPYLSELEMHMSYATSETMVRHVNHAAHVDGAAK